MKNKKNWGSQIIVVILSIAMILGNLWSILSPAKAGENDYRYKIVAKSNNTVIQSGGQAILWVTLQNLGTDKWIGWDTVTDNPLRLGTINPLDRNSGFYTEGNWKATNRVHWADQKEANPEENMSFGFKITAPTGMTSGIYLECFAPLIEKVRWLDETDIDGKNLCWDIEVTQGENIKGYAATTSGISFQHLTMAPGQTQEIEFEAINTGNQIWFNDIQSRTPMHLATVEPNDKESDLYDSDSWLTKNRPARLLEKEVAPGEKGHFQFTIKVPDEITSGEQILDKYWLVAENSGWLGRKTEQFFGVKVIVDEKAPKNNEKTNEDKINNQLDSGSGSAGGGGGNNDDDNNIEDPVVDLKVNENDQTITIEKDGSAELKWTSSRSDSCTASDDWNGEKNKNGTYSETINNITNNKKYTVSCTGNNKTVTDTVWVKVNQNTPTGTISSTNCNANSHLLSIAGQAEDTDHANTSHKIKFYSDQPASTSNYLGETWTNLATGNFNFTYINSEYTNNSRQKIYAYAVDQDTNKEYSIDNAENIVCQGEEETTPSVDLLLDESDQTKTIIQGDNIDLSWSSSNAINCQAIWTNKTTSSGSETLTPNADTIYTIRCNGANDSYDEDSVEVKVTEPPYHATLSVDKTNIMADQIDTATMKFNLLDDSDNILANHEVIVRDTTHFADSTVQSDEYIYQTNAKGNIYIYNSYNLEKNEQNSDTFDFLVDGSILKTTSISYIKPPTPIAESMIYANLPQILYDNLDEALVTVILRDSNGIPITDKMIDSRCHFLDSTNESTSASYYWPVYPNSNGAQFYQLRDNTSANNNNGAICTFRTMNDVQSNLWTMVNFVEEYTTLNYSSGNSVFSADKYQLINDGQDQVKISLELKDAQGNSLPADTKVDFAYGQIFDDNVTIGRNNNSYYTDQNGHIEFGITYDAAVETERKLTNMAWTYSVNGMPSNEWVKIKVVNGEETTATLAVALDGSVSSQTVHGSDQDTNLVALNFTTGNSEVTVNSIKLNGYIDDDANGVFTAGSSNGVYVKDIIPNAKIMYAGNQIGSITNIANDGTITFSDINFNIAANTSTVITLVADISSSAPYGGDPDRVAFGIADTATYIAATDSDLNSVIASGGSINDSDDPAVLITIPSISNNPPIGQIDNANCNSQTNSLRVTGSAQDPDSLNQNIFVKFYLGGRKDNGGSYIGQAVANADNHQFFFDYQPDPAFSQGTEQNIYAYGVDLLTGNDFIIDSIENIMCTIPSNNQPIGQITEATCSINENKVTLKGNAYDPDEPSESILLSFYLGTEQNSNMRVGGTQTDSNGDFDFSYTPNNFGEKTISVFGEDNLIFDQYYLLDTETGITCQDVSLLGELSVQRNLSTPNSNIILSGADNIEIGRFDLSATGEDMEIRSFGINIGDDNLAKKTIENVYVDFGNGNIAANSFYPDDDSNNQAFFNYLGAIVPKDGTLTFRILVDLREMDSEGTYSGKKINAAVNDDVYLTFLGMDSGATGTHFVNHVDGEAEATGNTMIVHKTAPLMIKSENTNNILEAGEKEVYKFGLNANNGDYEFGKFVLKYDKTGNYNIDNCSVYKSGTIVANGIIGTNSIAFSFNNSQRSPFSDYTVKCTFSGNFNNNDAFDSFIDADSSYVVNDTFQNLANTSANITWSDLSNNNHLDVTHNPTSSDFTNGYLLQSLGHQVLIYTSPEPAAPTVDLKANGSDGPITIDSGDNVTLSWTVTDATTCTASGAWSGSKNANDGSEVINNVTSDSTYTLQCTGDGGTDSDSAMVNVQIINSSSGFIFTRGGNIYKVNTDGTNEVQLTSDSIDSNPEVSADGWVYFSRTRSGGNHNIWKIRSDGTQPTKITNDDGNDTNPVLGNGKLFFQSNRTAGYEYYQSDLDGGNIFGFDMKNNALLGYTGAFAFHNGSGYLTTATVYCPGGCQYGSLYDYDINGGGKISPAFAGTTGATELDWNANGSILLFQCSITEASCGTAGAVYAYDTATAQKTMLHNAGSDPHHFGGNQIIFVNELGHLSIVNSDGTGYTDLNVSGNEPQYVS